MKKLKKKTYIVEWRGAKHEKKNINVTLFYLIKKLREEKIYIYNSNF